MDSSNVVDFLEAKRKQLAEEGKLIPLVVAAAAIVIGLIILAFSKSDKSVAPMGNGDKPVNVVVNLNERTKKVARRDLKDERTPVVAETPKKKGKKKEEKKEEKEGEQKEEETDGDTDDENKDGE